MKSGRTISPGHCVCARALMIIGLLSYCSVFWGAFGRSFSFKSFSLPKEAVAPGHRIHPVALLQPGRLDLVSAGKDSISIYRCDGPSVQLHQKVGVPSAQGGVLYYAFGRIAKGAPYSLMFLMSDGIYFYPLEKGSLAPVIQPLLKKALYRGEAPPGMHYFDFAVDLDNDGLEDLLLPEENGFSIMHQTSPGKFDPVELPRPIYTHEDEFDFSQNLLDDPVRAQSVSGRTSRRRGVLENKFLLFDANSDGLQDLIYKSTVPAPGSKENDRFDVFLQRKETSFGKKPDQTIEIPYDSMADITFRDLNNDRRLDAIVVKSNLDIANPRTAIKFYISGKEGKQLFTQETDRYVTKDPIGLVRVADFNSDGSTDFAMTFFSYQFGSAEDIVDLIVANKVRFKLQFYLGRGARMFNRQPDFEQQLELNLKAEGSSDANHAYPPVLIVNDMNGDKVMDLMVRPEEGRMAIYLSNKGMSYPREPSWEMAVPADAVADFADINGDGLNDIIVSSVRKQQLTIYLATPK